MEGDQLDSDKKSTACTCTRLEKCERCIVRYTPYIAQKMIDNMKKKIWINALNAADIYAQSKIAFFKSSTHNLANVHTTNNDFSNVHTTTQLIDVRFSNVFPLGVFEWIPPNMYLKDTKKSDVINKGFATDFHVVGAELELLKWLTAN